jgi:hypothetical protein
MPVPNTFANATATIPLSQLDANFATTITLGNTAIQLGNTVSTLNNMTLANVTVTSGNVTLTNVTVTTANVTTANTTTLVVTGNTTLGDASTDTVTVNGTMGVGGTNSFPAQYGAHIKNSALTGTNIYGALSEVTGPATATISINAFTSVPTTSANAFTVGIVRGFQAANAIKGVGSTITNQHGVWVADQTEGTNNFGITSQVSSGTNKWNIYASGTAANYFAGNVSIGTTTVGSPLNVVGAAGYVATLDGATDTRLDFKNSGTRNGIIATTSSAFQFTAPTAIPMLFLTNNTERMRIDSAGNLGLGVTPSAWGSSFKAIEMPAGGFITSAGNGINFGSNVFFNGTNYIYKSTATASLYATNTGQHIWYNAASGTAGNTITFTQAMTLSAAGDLGIGTTSIAAAVSRRGMVLRGNSNGAELIVQSTTATDGTSDGFALIAAGSDAYIYNRLTGGFMAFATSNTERARITSGGAFQVTASGSNNTFTDGGQISLKSSDSAPYISWHESTGARLGYLQMSSGGSAQLWVQANQALVFATNNTDRARITAAGGFTCAGIYNTTVGATNRDVFVDNGGVVGYVSSLRASKTNIENLTDTSWLYQLNPVTFNYRKKDEEGNYTDETDGDIQYGMIAEDVEQIRPDLCFYDEVDGQQELRGIQYSKLVPVMLKALQEQQQMIETLQAKVAALEGKK